MKTKYMGNSEVAHQNYREKVKAQLPGKIDEQKEKEVMDQAEIDSADYYDNNLDFIAWKARAGKACSFHACEEQIDEDAAHNFIKVLVLNKGEDLQKKLASLRQLGYTAKYVKEL